MPTITRAELTEAFARADSDDGIVRVKTGGRASGWPGW